MAGPLNCAPEERGSVVYCVGVPSPDHRYPPRTFALLAVLVVVLLAGCSGPEGPAVSPASAAPVAAPSPTELPPADAVQAALQRLTASTYTYTVTGDYWNGQKYRAAGTHDPRTREDSRTYVISGGRDATTRKVIVIGDDSYLDRDGSNRWVHARLTRLKPSSAHRYADPKDPGGLVHFTAAINATRRLDAHRYEGEARLEFTPDALTYLPLGAPVFRFRQGGLWASYTLSTDAEGDVTSITTSFETAQHESVRTTTTFKNVGRPVQISKPSRVAELRSSRYAE
jgi:hypothetical protein